MHTRPFGRLGWPVSEIGYGMWGLAGWTGSDDSETRDSLQRSVELGCNFFDTAYAYGEGKSEQMLGELLRAHPTKRLFAASKIPPKNRKWPARREYRLEDVYPYDYIIEMTDRSLANLGVESLDLMQFHVWDDSWAQDAGWQRAVRELTEGGKVRAFGISVNRWEPENVIRTLDTGLIDAVQVIYNIFDQNPEDELFPCCVDAGVAIIARVPFDEGTLTGTLSYDSTWPEDDWRHGYFNPENLRASVDRAEALRPLIPPGMSMPEFALRFILSHPAVATVIPGMRRRPHVDANIAASDGRGLPADLITKLRAHRWDRRPTDWSQ